MTKKSFLPDKTMQIYLGLGTFKSDVRKSRNTYSFRFRLRAFRSDVKFSVVNT